MTAPTTIRSPYDKRLDLVTDTITSNSSLDDSAAGELAVHILQVLNSIPEIVR